jgi:hypothetical protein
VEAVRVQCEEVSMSPKKDTPTSAKSSTANDKKLKGFTDEERAAMKERSQELLVEEPGSSWLFLAVPGPIFAPSSRLVRGLFNLRRLSEILCRRHAL